MIVARLDFGQPFFVHARGGQLVVQRDEAEQMVLHAAAGVIGTGAGAQNERPVARLRQQQFARGLFQRARLAGRSPFSGKFPRQSGHAFLRDLQVRINPFVLLVQPRAQIAFLAPAGRAGRGDLVGRMPVADIRRA
jgi:hypothetical protein